MTYHFSEEERGEIIVEFKTGVTHRALAKKFRGSCSTIGRFFKKEIENYKEIAKEHSRIGTQKALAHPNTIMARPETARKMGLKYGPITGPNNLEKWRKEHPEEALKALQKGGRKAWAGEKNPNWKGGISILEFENGFGMSQEEWQTLAQEIRKRDKFVCQYCGKKRSTSIHHIIPRHVKIDNHPDNLITVCRSCHIKVERLTDKYLKKNKDPIEIFYDKWST